MPARARPTRRRARYYAELRMPNALAAESSPYLRQHAENPVDWLAWGPAALEQLPFYGGTYFPPDPRHGMPSWTQVLQAISESWQQNREEIRAGGERLRDRLSGAAHLMPSTQPIAAGALDAAANRLGETFDR